VRQPKTPATDSRAPQAPANQNAPDHDQIVK
jgi:hypothetical protein